MLPRPPLPAGALWMVLAAQMAGISEVAAQPPALDVPGVVNAQRAWQNWTLNCQGLAVWLSGGS